MNVLLVNPPMQVHKKPETPSFGIAFIAQELKRNGYGVEIIDIDANRFSKDEVLHLIENSKPDVIGIGGLVTIYPYLDWLVPEIKKLKPGKEIILGGAIASSLKHRCFDRFAIDYEVIGEGEITIIELLKEIAGNRKFDNVKGIGFRKDEKIFFTEPRPLMSSLDNLPMFDDTMFPMERLLENTGGNFLIHTQRGCPSNCTFCFNAFRVVSNHVRYRPVEHVINEIEIFRRKYKNKISHFGLSGECVTMNKDWIIRFCKEVIRRNLNISYRVTSRVDTLDEERLDWLKRSGCSIISLGVESGSEKILKIMKKSATVEKGRLAVELCKKYIPYVQVNIMLGYVGEDKNTLSQTMKFCKQLGVRPSVFFATPFPGTELYKMALEKGVIKDEENYMMALDAAWTGAFALNLTDMPYDEAKKAIESTVEEIERHYLWQEIKNLQIIRHIITRIQEDGITKAISKILKRIKKLYLPSV